MQEPIDLKSLERKAFRSIYQDGLWHIYIGGLVLANGIFFSMPEAEEGMALALNLGLLILIVGAAVLIYRGGRKWITAPRLGTVKFGARRTRRKWALTAILFVFVLVHTIFLGLSIGLWRNPQWAQQAASWLPKGAGAESLLLGVLVGAWLGIVLLVISYFNDIPWGYYAALVMAAGFFFGLGFELYWLLFVAAALLIAPGVVMLRRFLQKYPRPVIEAAR